MLTPTRLHHLALVACDPERVAAFYRDVLGLPERARHFEANGALRSVWLDLGGAVLMIERSTVQAGGTGTGSFLIAVRVEAAERAAAERALEAAGAPIESRTEHTSYARDPEGNRVAVSDYAL